ncbi:MAG: DUF1292 domain-containing protein [Bacillales bacterium]|nr:DUF1292 domain-containing protein [Bacillales bacterium]
MNDNKLVYVDENGKEVELTIYLSYHSDTFNKDYIFFYEDENNDLLVAGWVDKDGNIHDIETDEEYNELDEVLEDYQDSLENK